MGQIVPEPIERYLASLNQLPDAVLLDIAKTGVERDLPLINAEVGALLRVLATAVGATRILEIGTAVGYSGIWLAGALPPHGTMMTMEMDESRARIARENFARAGLTDRVTIVVGDARRMVHKMAGPFDLIFQDGDKLLYGPLLDPLVDRLRAGGLLVTDNVLWSGEVVPGFNSTAHQPPEQTRAIADYNTRLHAHPQLMTTIVPLRDGVAISVKRGRPELAPLLDTLSRATRSLREADFNDDASHD